MGAPGFWDSQERAAKVSAEHARVNRRVQTLRELERDVGDLEPLAELAEEDRWLPRTEKSNTPQIREGLTSEPGSVPG